MQEIDGRFYDDPRIDDKYRDYIQELPKETCSARWDAYVNSFSRHVMLMKNDEWPASLTKKSEPIYLWAADWNANRSEPLISLLDDIIPNSDEEVFVFWSRESGMKTYWNAFRNNWVNFLYEDEGVVVVFRGRLDSLIFSCGRVWHGYRNTENAKS